MRLTTRPLEADAEPFDPENPGPFTRLAGDYLVGIEGDTALVRTPSGCVMHVHAGWLAFKVDGGSEVHFMTPEHVGGGPECEWAEA